MKIFELRRHSVKQQTGDKDLSERGKTVARLVGEKQMRGKVFTSLYVSGMRRTVETLELMAEGAGDFPAITPEVFPPQGSAATTPEAMTLWVGVCHSAERNGEDMMMAVLRDDWKRAEHIAEQGAAAFRAFATAVPDGSRVLVIGHSPFLELIAYSLFKKTLPQLQPCDGFRITVNGADMLLTSIVSDQSLNAASIRDSVK